MVILDTDHISLIERLGHPMRDKLLSRLEADDASRPVVTVISYEEQTRGWLARIAGARSLLDQVMAYGRLQEQLESYCRWTVLPFDEVAATKFQELRKLKLRVGTMDLKIAAIALANDATLLSRNQSDFGRVPGLKVENWTQ